MNVRRDRSHRRSTPEVVSVVNPSTNNDGLQVPLIVQWGRVSERVKGDAAVAFTAAAGQRTWLSDNMANRLKVVKASTLTPVKRALRPHTGHLLRRPDTTNRMLPATPHPPSEPTLLRKFKKVNAKWCQLLNAHRLNKTSRTYLYHWTRCANRNPWDKIISARQLIPYLSECQTTVCTREAPQPFNRLAQLPHLLLSSATGRWAVLDLPHNVTRSVLGF